MEYTDTTEVGFLSVIAEYECMENRDVQGAATETATIETTIGDLIEAITDIALQAGRTEEEGYKLASFTIEKVLRDKRRRDLLS